MAEREEARKTGRGGLYVHLKVRGGVCMDTQVVYVVCGCVHVCLCACVVHCICLCLKCLLYV